MRGTGRASSMQTDFGNANIGLSVVLSTLRPLQESDPAKLLEVWRINDWKENAPGVTLTRGPRIRNPVLYPPELRGHTVKIYHNSVSLQHCRQFRVSHLRVNVPMPISAGRANSLLFSAQSPDHVMRLGRFQSRE